MTGMYSLVDLAIDTLILLPIPFPRKEQFREERKSLGISVAAMVVGWFTVIAVMAVLFWLGYLIRFRFL
jgi:hypothetical protein